MYYVILKRICVSSSSPTLCINELKRDKISAVMKLGRIITLISVYTFLMLVFVVVVLVLVVKDLRNTSLYHQRSVLATEDLKKKKRKRNKKSSVVLLDLAAAS